MHSKLHISSIPLILKKKGVKNVIIAPGSRNAPLTQVFFREFGDNCISIVDERSAAYFALGIALETQIPVVIITTSGTAVLNLAPAIAEAFYQGVSIIALTADRPPEWIDQEDNQTIRQKDIFGNNIKKSFELPVQTTVSDDLWLTERIINEAYNTAVSGKAGPVHVNIPLREPLYDTIPSPGPVNLVEHEKNNGFVISDKLISEYREAENILIVVGQRKPGEQFNQFIKKLLSDKRVCISAEAIANIPESVGVINLDIVLATNKVKDIPIPDLVIYIGGHVVSKRLKNYIRSLENCEQWYISPEGNHVDTFKRLHVMVQADETQFIRALVNQKEELKNSDYQEKCNNIYKSAILKVNTETNSIEYSDLGVFQLLSGKFSANDIVFAGNSSVIRYYQFFSNRAGKVYANRGTSGIDGCLSTAAGIASTTKSQVFAILGDLSFLYDSNGLWNNNLPDNLKIIVIQNGGGGIFSLIEGPSKQPEFEKYFQTKSGVDISMICKAFQVQYYRCESLRDLKMLFDKFSSDTTSLMEIKTSPEVSPVIFRNFIDNLKRN